MTAPELGKHHADAVQPPPLMNAVEYQNLLERLVSSAQGYGKTESVAGFLLRDLHIVTETSSGKDEVVKDVKVEPHYLVMDLDQYPNDYVQKLVVQDIMTKYAMRVVGDAEINTPDFKGAGLWTSKKSSFDEDYQKDPNVKNNYQPNPDAYRVCLTTDKDIVMPVQWGEFTVEAGGTVAIREKDIPALTEALQNIRAGKISPQEALLDDEGKARFDVYGMEPGFLNNNYAEVELKPETLTAAQSLISSGVKVNRHP